MIAPSGKDGQKKARKPIKFRLALWCAFFVTVTAIVVMAIRFSGMDKESTTDPVKVRGLIPEATPVKIGLVEGVDEIPKPVIEKTAVAEPKTNQWGNPAHWGHKKLRPAMVHRIDRSRMPLFEQIFENGADRAIAGLLVIEPGTDLIGDDTFGETFTKSFLRSLEKPIVISKDDSDEAKALKRAVIDTKIELKARYDGGEDIAKTLTDIRRELRELGAYRQDIKKLIEEQSHDHGMTADDMRDFVNAANVMLEERGAKPIVMPEFYYKQIELRNQKIKALKGK